MTPEKTRSGREGYNIERILKENKTKIEVYVDVAQHLVDTLKYDQIVEEARFEEDMRKMAEMMATVTEGDQKHKWNKVVDILSPWK